MNKITGDESAQPVIKTTRDSSTLNGIPYVYGDTYSVGGISIRMHFAAMATPDVERYSIKFMEDIMGEKYPDNNTEALKIVEFHAAFKARLKIIEADALIAELNKTITK